MKLLNRPSPALLLLLTTVQAEKAVTSSGLVNEALDNNPEIRFFEAEIDAGGGGRQSGDPLANPERSTEFGGMSPVQAKEGLVWRASILQEFSFPGRMGLEKAIVDRDIELTPLGFQQFQSQLANEVRARAIDELLLQRKEAAPRSVPERLESVVEVLVHAMPAP